MVSFLIIYTNFWLSYNSCFRSTSESTIIVSVVSNLEHSWEWPEDKVYRFRLWCCLHGIGFAWSQGPFNHTLCSVCVVHCMCTCFWKGQLFGAQNWTRLLLRVPFVRCSGLIFTQFAKLSRELQYSSCVSNGSLVSQLQVKLVRVLLFQNVTCTMSY